MIVRFAKVAEADRLSGGLQGTSASAKARYRPLAEADPRSRGFYRL